ncbi:MAG: Hsp20/alpha crystallin family protein [Candidatus Aureabacteria bacterium]|nr:Hsp20/alpha crystallin family protein [Candidatus Auribacterota bacterium]
MRTILPVSMIIAIAGVMPLIAADEAAQGPVAPSGGGSSPATLPAGPRIAPPAAPWGYPPPPVMDDPWAYVREMQDRINRMVEDSYRRFGSRPQGPADSRGLDFYPAADVRETDREIIVQCDLPGMEKDKIKVSYKDGALVISGTRDAVKEESGSGGFYTRERNCGSFERVIPVSAEIKEKEIKAEYKNGVLIVTLPKVEVETKPGTKIQIL